MHNPRNNRAEELKKAIDGFTKRHKTALGSELAAYFVDLAKKSNWDALAATLEIHRDSVSAKNKPTLVSEGELAQISAWRQSCEEAGSLLETFKDILPKPEQRPALATTFAAARERKPRVDWVGTVDKPSEKDVYIGGGRG